MSSFEGKCEAIAKDRQDKYHNFWNECPLVLLKHHLAFKAFRATFITDHEKLKEEMIDIANYSKKVYERTEAKK